MENHTKALVWDTCICHMGSSLNQVSGWKWLQEMLFWKRWKMSSFFRSCHPPNSALSPLLKMMMPVSSDPITRKMIGLPHVKLEATDFFDTHLSKKNLLKHSEPLTLLFSCRSVNVRRPLTNPPINMHLSLHLQYVNAMLQLSKFTQLTACLHLTGY